MATKTIMITVLLEPEQLAKINAFAHSEGTTRSDLIRDTVIARINRKAKKQKQQAA